MSLSRLGAVRHRGATSRNRPGSRDPTSWRTVLGVGPHSRRHRMRIARGLTHAGSGGLGNDSRLAREPSIMAAVFFRKVCAFRTILPALRLKLITAVAAVDEPARRPAPYRRLNEIAGRAASNYTPASYRERIKLAPIYLGNARNWFPGRPPGTVTQYGFGNNRRFHSFPYLPPSESFYSLPGKRVISPPGKSTMLMLHPIRKPDIIESASEPSAEASSLPRGRPPIPACGAARRFSSTC